MRRSGGPVLGRTLRLIPVGGGRRLLVYVAHGNGGFTLTDPAGCLRARRARLAKLAPDPDEHNAAERVLAQMRDTMPGAQTLDISILAPGKAAPGAGTGIPLTAGQDLPTGVVLSGGGVYVGIAKPDVTSIALRSARTRSVRRSVAVHHGLFAFSLPRHTGPVVLTQRTADGRPITVQRIRQ